MNTQKNKEYKIKNLFFAYIRGTHLEKNNVTAEDLAKNLEKNGFIELVSENRYVYTEKKLDQKNKAEFWKCVDACPSSQNLGKRQRPLLTLLVLFCLGFGLAVPLDLFAYPSNQILALRSNCRSIPKFRDLKTTVYFFEKGYPYKGAYRENY